MEAKTSDREDSKDAKEDSIVAKVGRYFFEDSSFSQTFEEWVSKNAPRIDPSLQDDEYPLEYTTLYEEFKKLYEGLLEDYIEREGSSTEAFYAELREATERARKAGDSVSALTIRHINPLPDGLEDIFAGFNHVYVVENNDEGLYGYGQLCALLRAKYCDPKIEGINKTDGLTWRVKDVLARVQAKLEEK